MNVCGVSDLFVEFYQVTSTVSQLFKQNVTVHFLWFSMSFFPGGRLSFPEFHFETEAKVDFPSACI